MAERSKSCKGNQLGCDREREKGTSEVGVKVSELIFLDRGFGAKAQISLMRLRVRKVGACGWAQLVRGKEEMNLEATELWDSWEEC